ncbi:MAG: ABC transporter permease [Proteobacteria bacterium]|nr:ABC transporter permease [Pseudomonadota bacterium]
MERALVAQGADFDHLDVNHGGVSLLVSEWSAYRSLQQARDSYYRDYKFGDLFADFKKSSTESLHQIAEIPGIEDFDLRISVEGLINVPGRMEPSVGRLISVPSGLQPKLNRIHLRKGRLPVDSNEAEIIVHEGFASANSLDPGDRFSIIVQGQSQIVRVVGIGLSPEYVYALSSNAPLPDDLHFGVFWMTEKKLQQLLKMSGGYNSLVAAMTPSALSHEVISDIDRVLKPFGSLGAYTRDRQISNVFVADEISQQRVSAIFIPAIFLAIAAFLINIITSRLVVLHQPQIAALKAMGYTRVEISVHYLKMIFIMALTGTIPGIGVGALLGRCDAAPSAASFSCSSD